MGLGYEHRKDFIQQQIIWDEEYWEVTPKKNSCGRTIKKGGGVDPLIQ